MIKKLGSKLIQFFALIGLVLLAVILISTFVLCLSGAMFLSQRLASNYGYVLSIPEGVQTAVMTVGGAITVALVALYGVHRSNISAEKRHKVDASLTLRKDIFLQVAESAAVQYQVLLSYIDERVSNKQRENMTKHSNKAFYKLQTIASQQTIQAMLQANRSWSIAMQNISRKKPNREETQEEIIDRFEFILAEAQQYQRNLWKFNVIARAEIGCAFDFPDLYLTMMEGETVKIKEHVNDLRKFSTLKNDLQRNNDPVISET